MPLRAERVQSEEAKETGARNSRSSLSDGRKKGPQHERKFAAEVASVVGGGRNPESVKRDVQLKIARAEKLGTDLHKIAGTSLDEGGGPQASRDFLSFSRRPVTLSIMCHRGCDRAYLR